MYVQRFVLFCYSTFSTSFSLSFFLFRFLFLLALRVSYSFSSLFSFLRMKQSSFAHLFVVFAVGYSHFTSVIPFSCQLCVHSIIPVMNVVRFNHRKCSLFFPAFHTKLFKYLRARDNSSIKIQVRPLQSAAVFSHRCVPHFVWAEGMPTRSARIQHTNGTKVEASAAKAKEEEKKKLFRKLALRKMWMPSGTLSLYV